MKVAISARVSTHDQTAVNQLLELRRYADARGWACRSRRRRGGYERCGAGLSADPAIEMSKC